MKYWKYCLIILVILVNLLFTEPLLAAQNTALQNLNNFYVGQRVIWLYKAHSSYGNIQRIPGEVVKLGSKQVQIKVKKNDHEFVNRWVSREKLVKVNS